MHWRSFVIWNALGGITWATAIGLIAYFLGHSASNAIQAFGLYGLAAVRSRSSAASLCTAAVTADARHRPAPEDAGAGRLSLSPSLLLLRRPGRRPDLDPARPVSCGLGIETSSTPCSKLASIASASTPSGRPSERWKRRWPARRACSPGLLACAVLARRRSSARRPRPRSSRPARPGPAGRHAARSAHPPRPGRRRESNGAAPCRSSGLAVEESPEHPVEVLLDRVQLPARAAIESVPFLFLRSCLLSRQL